MLNLVFIVSGNGGNYDKLIDSELVELYKNSIIKLHYSILQSFKKLNAVKRAIRNNIKFLGTTVHFVDEKVDNGRIISQNLFPFYQNNLDIKKIMEKLFKAGCLNLLNSILLLEQKSHVYIKKLIKIFYFLHRY